VVLQTENTAFVKLLENLILGLFSFSAGRVEVKVALGLFPLVGNFFPMLCVMPHESAIGLRHHCPLTFYPS
jgi:hypothetical protein